MLVEIFKTEVYSDKIVIMLNEGIIHNILFRGNKITGDALIFREIETEPGEIFNIFHIENDVKNIYGTNFFNLVDYAVEPLSMVR